MRSWSLTVFVAATLMAGCKTERTGFTPQDEATIRALNDSALAYVNRGDWTKWAGLYADDAIFQPPNGRPVVGRSAIEAFGHAFPPVESMQVFDLHIDGSGEMAYLTSGFAAKFKSGAIDTAKQIVVLRKKGGEWKATAVSFSSNLAPPSVTQAGAPAKK